MQRDHIYSIDYNDDDVKKHDQKAKKQSPIEDVHWPYSIIVIASALLIFLDQVKAGKNSYNVNNKIIHFVHSPCITDLII